MDKTYQAASIETSLQAEWESDDRFHVTEDISKEKFYCLAMFPYPSGQLHMGHVRNYTIGDVIARYQRMRGKNVLQPMGWDAFGLPAENAALKHGVAPAKWTVQNIGNMRQQLKRLGFGYDWQREISTCDPSYYRWEQWLFTRLLAKGLVYRKNAVVNWDPVDHTVLANEQVIDGRGWRSGALVERREIPQWFLKITAYADELLDELDSLTEWPEQVRTMQRNWIGRSEGALINFEILDQQETLSIFTTRADTLFGVTYLAIAPQHPLALKAAENDSKLLAFIESCQQLPVAEAAVATAEKQGLPTPYFAIHPLTGENLPVWVANFVLADYGTGAAMAVPAHDERDHAFAQQYDLPIKPVIAPSNNTEWHFEKAAYTGAGLLISSGEFSGLSSIEARKKITEHLEKNNVGDRKVTYRLRDWGISRQRYWGTPIPVIICDRCGDVPVPEKDLPVMLPTEISFHGPHSPLKALPEFYQVICPSCGEMARRETDTFDTFVESSWYFARYACPHQDKAMLDGRADYWLPVDQYIGGIEHAVLHLLYARFFHKLLRDEGLVRSDEPFTQLLTQGMVLKEGSKMSKSKGNTVDPTTLIEKYGADAVRLFVMFAAPPEQSLEWSDAGVEGANRFLKRLWNFSYGIIEGTFVPAKPLLDSLAKRQCHEILRQIQTDYDRKQYNTVVSGAMKLLNLLLECTYEVAAEGLEILLKILAPITPHICTCLWRALKKEEIEMAGWPTVDANALEAEIQQMVVQINGKFRGNVLVTSGADEQTIQKSVYADPHLQKFLEGKSLRKMIIVPNKLINLVLET